MCVRVHLVSLPQGPRTSELGCYHQLPNWGPKDLFLLVVQSTKTRDNEWPYDVSSSTESRQVGDCQPAWVSLVCSAAQEWLRGPGAPYLANSGHSLSPKVSDRSSFWFCSIFLLLPITIKTRTGERHPKMYNKINATIISIFSTLGHHSDK